MPDVFLHSQAKLLALLHALGAMVLVGASTHQAVITVGYLRGRCAERLGRIYAATIAVAYVVTFILGSLVYPTFRYFARDLYLDRHAAWASNLFDIKENLASLGLPLAVGAFVLSRVLDPRADRALLAGYAVMVFGGAAIVWFEVVSGLLITMARGV